MRKLRTRLWRVVVAGPVLILAIAVAVLSAQVSPDVALRQAMEVETVKGDLRAAIELYRPLVESGDRTIAARALARMAASYEKLGDARARTIYERIVREFADQAEPVALARAKMGGSTDEMAARGDRAVWTGPKVDLFGRVSRDGRFLTFTDWSGFGDLALHDLRTNTDRLLTANSGRDGPNSGEAQYSAISPDGQQVAYGWWRQDSREIRVVPVSGAGAQRPRTLLTFRADEVRSLGVRDWAPDGRTLAIGIQRSDGASQIIVATVSDGSMRVLKSTAWSGAGPMFFSRDGRHLAFDLPASNENNAQRDVFILAVDGSHEVKVVADVADDLVAGWSPDGRHLLFSSTRTRARSLWALPVSDGRPLGQPQLVKTDIGSTYPLGVTPSGALHVWKFVTERDVRVAPIDLDAGKLAGEPRHFSQGLLARPQSPNWSPDGKFLAYQVRGDDEANLAVRSVETGHVRRMPRNIPYLTDPRWSPDGDSLIVGGRDRNGRDGIFRIDVPSGDVQLVAPTAGLRSLPRWSTDGSRIYYTAASTIRERDLRTGAERDVFTHSLMQNGGEVSPDGRYLAVQTSADPVSRTSSVWLVPAEGGEPRELVRGPAASLITSFSTLAWTPDGRALLTARRGGAAVELWLIEIETGRARKLDIDVGEWSLAENLPGLDSGFALSPDGRSIAFLVGKSGAEVWAMEGWLPRLSASK